jgi:hypothetical protein
MDTWITLVVVLAAAIYLIRRLYKKLQHPEDGQDGCASCGQCAQCANGNCTHPDAQEAIDLKRDFGPF